MNENSIELYEKLHSLQWLLHKNRLRAHAINGPMADPTRGQGRIIAILKLQDGISTKDLSYLLGIRVSSLNELLAKMEKNGYIMREPSEADRRIMLVKLTEKGKNEEQQKWDPGDFFACLSEDDQKAFGEYLDRIIAAHAADFEEHVGDDVHEWWTRGGRERMGEEQFERLRSMAGGGHPLRGCFGRRDGGPADREDPMFGRPHRHHRSPQPPMPKKPHEPEEN